MTIREIIIKIYIIHDIPITEIQGCIAHFIDSYLVLQKEFEEFHFKNVQKNYVFDLPISIDKDKKIYEGDKIYQFRIRTADEKLAAYIMSGIADHKTEDIKGLTRQMKYIPKKHLEKVYTLTPMVLIDAKGRGYWRDVIGFEEFEKTLCQSLIAQYEKYTGEKLDADLPLYDCIELKSKCGIGINYKGITLIGDKVSIQVADNEVAQKVMYFALANGIGTKGSRGCGFLGYRFM